MYKEVQRDRFTGITVPCVSMWTMDNWNIFKVLILNIHMSLSQTNKKSEAATDSD
ncbi:hypothetical protein EXN66_Car016402 [Channa argus]|uniref:Uncharacterized protein n=1 Tax=Channa argus TaxID=215402 RepID=A0A6G1QE62_CHAAH|nr:hypothetical protein EXN66_Car016402 [Channa argus]